MIVSIPMRDPPDRPDRVCTEAGKHPRIAAASAIVAIPARDPPDRPDRVCTEALQTPAHRRGQRDRRDSGA
jgi:hypothetical protein